MDDSEAVSSSATERTYLGKLMWRLIPFLAILYVFCLLDRGNLGIAALRMQKDLGFSDTVYGAGAGIFFLGYFFFEVPSNLIMQRVGARRWIARIMLTWGAISAAMMFVHTVTSFYILRFLLGVAEAGFYPGILLYMTYWVPGNARAQVISRFLALSAVLGLFGSPLGGELLELNGWHGLAGWQWLFLIEGLPSMLLGFVVLKFLPDMPAQADWLTPAEKDWVGNCIEQESRKDDGRVEHFTWKSAFAEPRVFFLCLIFFITATAGNAVGFFMPQLIKARSGGLWSDPFVAKILIIPAIAGAIMMNLAAKHSDKTGRRRLHVALGYFVAALGFLYCVYAPSAWVLILALSIYTMGERVGAGSYWAVTTSLMGARAAAGGLAFINSVGNLGGFFGPTLMGYLKQRTGGGYAAGLYMAAGLMLAASVLALATFRQAPTRAEKGRDCPGSGR